MKANKQNAKILVFACFSLVFAVTLNAVDTKKITAVRNKDVLEDPDLRAIDEFVEDAIREILEAKDFTNISAVRDALVKNSSSNRPGPDKQYRPQFRKSVLTHITEAFKTAQDFPADRRFLVSVNLLMIIENLRDVQLSTLALDRLNDSNAAVRYWAMKCFSSPEVIKLLNEDPGQSVVVSRIINRLDKLIGNSDDAMLVLIANFASELKADEATKLLVTIADQRLRQYENWQVKNELTDITVLKALCNKIISKQDVPQTAPRFSQLYSYIIQRYIKGNNLDDHRQKLISAMVEVEDLYIRRLLGVKQTMLREALEKKDRNEQLKALEAEHNSLLGSATSEGKLPVKWQFTYRCSEGKESTAPCSLPPQK